MAHDVGRDAAENDAPDGAEVARPHDQQVEVVGRLGQHRARAAGLGDDPHGNGRLEAVGERAEPRGSGELDGRRELHPRPEEHGLGQLRVQEHDLLELGSEPLRESPRGAERGTRRRLVVHRDAEAPHRRLRVRWRHDGDRARTVTEDVLRDAAGLGAGEAAALGRPDHEQIGLLDAGDVVEHGGGRAARRDQWPRGADPPDRGDARLDGGLRLGSCLALGGAAVGPDVRRVRAGGRDDQARAEPLREPRREASGGETVDRAVTPGDDGLIHGMSPSRDDEVGKAGDGQAAPAAGAACTIGPSGAAVATPRGTTRTGHVARSTTGPDTPPSRTVRTGP
jgi:hypothetical protein